MLGIIPTSRAATQLWTDLTGGRPSDALTRRHRGAPMKAMVTPMKTIVPGDICGDYHVPWRQAHGDTLGSLGMPNNQHTPEGHTSLQGRTTNWYAPFLALTPITGDEMVQDTTHARDTIEYLQPTIWCPLAYLRPFMWWQWHAWQ